MGGYLSPEEAQSLTFVDQPGAGRLTGSIASDCLVGACSSVAKEGLGAGYSNTRRDQAHTFVDQPGAGRLAGSLASDCLVGACSNNAKR